MKIDGSPFLPPEYDSICIDWSKKCIEIDNYYQKTFAQFQKEHWIWLNKILVGISKFIIQSYKVLIAKMRGYHLYVKKLGKTSSALSFRIMKTRDSGSLRLRFTPDNGFWKSSLRKESGCSVLAMQDQLT